MLSGPGCPVCVTASADLDRAIDVLVEMKNVSEAAVGLAYSALVRGKTNGSLSTSSSVVMSWWPRVRATRWDESWTDSSTSVSWP